MKPIEPEELSGYIDGELAPQRMRDIETAMANDSALRLAYQTIAEADATWRLAARSAQFEPKVHLPRPAWPQSPVLACAAVLLLVVVRALPKLSDTLAVGLLVQLPVLIALMLWVVALTRQGTESDGPPKI